MSEPRTRATVPSTHLGAGDLAIAVLRFIDGPLADREFELPAEATIGRRSDCTIALPADLRAVSGLHCTIQRTPGGLWIVRDADSTGATLLNRTAVRAGTSPVLRSGDVIGLGTGGPTALFTLRSSTYVGEQPTHTYAITLARADGAGERRRFVDRPLLFLGRERACEIRFDAESERGVSKRHARIRYAGRCFLVEDLESTGGTYVNGVRTAASVLRPGDIVELGSGGPRLVVEVLEGIDDAAPPEDMLAARRAGRRRTLIALVLALATIGGLAAVLRLPTPPTADAPAPAPATSSTERFQELIARHGPAVLLVHAEFRIEIDGVHGPDDPFYRGDTYGSGFAITSTGIAVTNRHVVEPWLGDPEHAGALRRAREAFGADAVRIVSRVTAWPAGTELRTEDGRLAPEHGFATDGRANLRVVGFPPQHLVDVPYEDTTVELVANDDTDLALLELTGLALEAENVPDLAPAGALPRPLDAVVGLGFPAGAALLEGTAASLSPTLGQVRKVERTIQLSMPTYPGNSGGPVLDADGHVVGITTRRFGEGVAVCIPVAKVRALLQHLGR